MFDDIVGSLSKTVDLLTILREEPVHKADLADELDVSKSTVYNWTSELEALGLCERTTGGYAITRIGRAHLRLYHDFADLSRRIYRDNELLDELPAECVPPAPILMDMRAATSGQDPYALVERFTARAREADKIRCLLPSASSPVLSGFTRGLDCGAFDLEIVVESSVREYIEANHPEFCAALADAAGGTLVETAATIEVGLGLFEGESSCTVLTASNERGYVTGTLTGESDAALSWGTDLYEQYRAEGEALDPTDIGS
ncbi:helix-turn-helix transcriptional regulator [Haloarchaeobius sp. DYHT-AS-18]|uniref:helix-turn-helix transcriptional regulator n=1 Tax=Haloarchaeobius sp. DYHT-AS-18 TaxID=3446117 RepID=UPI003EC13021